MNTNTLHDVTTLSNVTHRIVAQILIGKALLVYGIFLFLGGFLPWTLLFKGSLAWTVLGMLVFLVSTSMGLGRAYSAWKWIWNRRQFHLTPSLVLSHVIMIYGHLFGSLFSFILIIKNTGQPNWEYILYHGILIFGLFVFNPRKPLPKEEPR